MELEEYKQVWTQMQRLLEQQQQWNLSERRERSLARLRGGFWPLYLGQIAQMVFGVAMMLLAVSYWSAHWHVWYRLLTGLVLHAYGLIVVLMAGLTLGQLQAIDFSEPVVAIRRRVARVTSTYILNGMLVGLPWWILWLLVVAVLASYTGQDLFRTAPVWFTVSFAVGAVGLLATWGFHCWVNAPPRAAWGKRLRAAAAGGSLSRAQRILDELAEFEHDAGAELGEKVAG